MEPKWYSPNFVPPKYCNGGTCDKHGHKTSWTVSGDDDAALRAVLMWSGEAHMCPLCECDRWKAEALAARKVHDCDPYDEAWVKFGGHKVLSAYASARAANEGEQ